MVELPRWVWDLVMHLERVEDEHPKDNAWCPAAALEIVPTDVRAHASSIAAYKSAQGSADIRGIVLGAHESWCPREAHGVRCRGCLAVRA